MTRKAHLEPHFSNEELKESYRLSSDKVESRVLLQKFLEKQKF